ncbi:MAG: DNA primase [Blastocatellia bacterium]
MATALSMQIPRGFSDELRNQADLVRVVSDYVTLKKKGRDYAACCPFHHEKTPSFYVSPGKQIFKCFGCGKAGSVFDFVMEIEGVNFPEAVRIVADKSGVMVPQVEKTPDQDARNREREDLRQLNQWAVEFFESQLHETAEGRRALEYVEKRGITPDNIRAFRLGYGPNSWDAMSAYLAKRGASRMQIERSGLVSLRDSGTGYYDKFRGRLMFPINDAQGRVVAFGGRIIGEGEPKYLNSPETALYTKGQHLFGLSHARDSIRRRGYAILVEGYMDFLVPFQYGVQNLVASLGTALTETQVKLLGRYARKIVVNFDPDSAGVAATKRSLETLLGAGFRVNVLTLPDNLDPDEYIRSAGSEGYYKLLKNSQSFLDYIVEQAVGENDLTRPAGKVATLNAILPYMKLVTDRVELAEQCERIADRLKIDSKLIREEFLKSARTQRATVSETAVRATIAIKPAEKRLLELMLNQARVRTQMLRELSEQDYAPLRTAPIFRLLAEFENQGLEPSHNALISRLDDTELAQELLPQLMLGDISGVTDVDGGSEETLLRLEREARESLKGLRASLLRERQASLQTEINEAQRSGDMPKALELMRQKYAERQSQTLPASLTWPSPAEKKPAQRTTFQPSRSIQTQAQQTETTRTPAFVPEPDDPFGSDPFRDDWSATEPEDISAEDPAFDPTPYAQTQSADVRPTQIPVIPRVIPPAIMETMDTHDWDELKDELLADWRDRLGGEASEAA